MRPAAAGTQLGTATDRLPEPVGSTALRRRRLATLLLGLALAVLLPALLLSGAAAWQAARGQRQAAEGRLIDTAHALALAVDREIAGLTSAMQAFATSPVFLPDPEAANLAQVAAQAQRVAERLGAAVGLVDREERLVMTTLRPLGDSRPRVHSQELVERVFASAAPAVGNLVTGAASGRPTVGVGVPVQRADGGVALMVAASLEAERLRRMLATYGLPPKVFAAISDGRNVLVARTDALHDTLVGRPLPIANVRRFTGREDGLFRAVALDGTHRIFAFSTVRSAPGWHVFVGAPVAALTSTWQGPMINLALGGIVALLLGGWLALIAARRILGPVHRLRDHALAVAAGGGDGPTAAALPPADVDELDQLRRGFAAAETALRAREAELASVLEATGEGVIVLTPGWQVAFINGRGAALLGSRAELRGQGLWHAFPELVGGPLWEATRRSMTERIATTADSPYPLLGRHLHAECHPRPDGGIVVFFRDVTEERAAEAALRASEVRLRMALDAAGLGNWEYDILTGAMSRSGRVIAPRPDLPLAGYTFDDYLRATAHPDDVPRIRATFAQAISGASKHYRIEYRIRRPNGSGWLWIESYGGLVERDPDTGRPLRIGGVSRDVTARKAAEAALAESEARLRLALEAGNVGTFSWDLRSGRLVWDARMRSLWGLPPGVAPSRAAFRASLPPEELDRARAALADALDPLGCGRVDLELRVIGQADGVERHLAAQGRMVVEEGQAVRMIGTVIDVTPMRRAAQVLEREAEQLERLAEERGRALAASEARLAEAARMEALGRLAGGIAHDFNNVLQAVQGGLRLAEKRLAEDAGAAGRYLRLASDAAARGAAVTGRLLSFARRGALQAEPVSPAALLDGLAEMLRHALGPTITLRVEAPVSLPALWADRGQLEAVLVNLANNARDAMPDGGEILLRTEPLRDAGVLVAAGLVPGEWIRLSVVDSGEGMPPEVLARVTEPFFTTKPRGHGTGLGLAMARGFAEQSGGALTIGSTPGKGTDVGLILPPAPADARCLAAEPSSAMAQGDAPRSAPSRPPVVLLAEDEPEVREIMVAELGERGFAVTAATSGSAALALIEDGLRPDAVLTDLAMPGGLDGLSLLEEARRRLPRVPAVLVTGHAAEALPERLEAVERGGPFALVRKPAAAEVVADRLTRVLGQARTVLRVAG